MELFFDTETSGFLNKKLSADNAKQAWIMQIAFILSDKDKIYTECNILINAESRSCHPAAQAVHGISVEDCDKGGLPESYVVDMIDYNFCSANLLVAHNIFFDLEFIKHLMIRNKDDHEEVIEEIESKKLFCTMKSSTDLCKLPGRYGKYKWPKLTELYKFLFDEEMENAHDALADVRATRKCYYRLKELL